MRVQRPSLPFCGAGYFSREDRSRIFPAGRRIRLPHDGAGLERVILVGHAYAGMVMTGVSEVLDKV